MGTVYRSLRSSRFNEPDLGVSDCNITDISALASTINLNHINLSENPITDIGPLVENKNLLEGTSIILIDCPLNKTSLEQYVPLLKERKVEVILSWIK